MKINALLNPNQKNKKNFQLTLVFLTILISFININFSLSSKMKSKTNSKTNSKTSLESKNLNNINAQSQNYFTIQKALLSNNNIKVLNIIKKSPRVSTEGLFYENGNIYESGFYRNKSFLLKKDFKTNKMIKTVPLLSLSGKGIAKCGNNFYQLTDKEKKVLKYSYPNLDLISTYPLDNDMIKGEGLTSLSSNTLVATDGSNNIFILSCQYDLNVIKTIPIYDMQGTPMDGLQDITVVGDFLYANRDNDNRILKINPRNGAVVKTYDLMNLINYEMKMKSLSRNDIATGSVLNGIAYDRQRGTFILTGRNWAFYYEVRLN